MIEIVTTSPEQVIVNDQTIVVRKGNRKEVNSQLTPSQGGISKE
jgi:hypothetical protein